MVSDTGSNEGSGGTCVEEKYELILKELSRARLSEEAVNVEKIHFYKTDRRIDPKKADPFWSASGEIPILVSAPHAVRHFRQKKIKVSDQFTGSVVYLLNKLTGCHALATAKLYGGDPNADDPCIYKDRIAELCHREKIKVILDIHGAARDQEFDIDMGTNKGKNLLNKTKITDVLENNFRCFGLNTISYDHFAASGANTIANYAARELGIPAVQIEINKQYRVPNQNSQSFHRLMGALAESIKGII